MRKYRRDLERAHDAQPRDISRGHAGDVLTLVKDAAFGRRQEFGEEIEAGRLAGTVRTDKRMDGAARDAEVHAVHRDKTSKLLGEILCNKDRAITLGHCFFPL